MDDQARAEIEEANRRLAEISLLVFGEQATLRIMDPREVILLERNARFMKRPKFEQLRKNIQADGMLSSVPLCHDTPEGVECLSGNHRVKAAIKAGLKKILIIVLPTQETGPKIAKQLSHNALEGEDDMQILAELWAEMQELTDKIYSGLDSATVNELDKMSFAGLGAEGVRLEKVVLFFFPEEVDRLDEVLQHFADVSARDQQYLAPLEKYEALWKALVTIKKLQNIKNTAVALMALIDRIEQSAGSIASDAAPSQGAEGRCDSSPALSIT